MENSHTNRIRATLDEMEQQAHDVVDQHPLASTAVAMGIGFGVGLLLVQVLDTAHRESSPRRWIPEEAEGWVKKVQCHVRDAIHNSLPDAIDRYMRAFK